MLITSSGNPRLLNREGRTFRVGITTVDETPIPENLFSRTVGNFTDLFPRVDFGAPTNNTGIGNSLEAVFALMDEGKTLTFSPELEDLALKISTQSMDQGIDLVEWAKRIAVESVRKE